MPESIDPELWWIASLSRILRSTEPRTEGPLTLLELADELGSWAAGGRLSAWQRNRASLITEAAATASEVAQWGDKVTLALLDEIGRSLRDADILDSVARERILYAVGEARKAVTSEEAIRAQGRRLVSMARDEPKPLAHLSVCKRAPRRSNRSQWWRSAGRARDASWKLDEDGHLDRKLEKLEPRMDAYLDSLGRRRDPLPVLV